MFVLYIWLTVATVALAMALAYWRSGDPLHPLMFLGPMVMYVTGLAPAQIHYAGILRQAFTNELQVERAQAYVFAATLAMCLGALRHRLPRGQRHQLFEPLFLSPLAKQRLRVVAYVLGGLGLVSYVFQLSLAGGFVQAYSHAKGGGFAPSGYYAEAVLFTIPAVMLYMLSRSGERILARDYAIMVAFALPNLIAGSLGSRRGPLFIAVTTLAFAWFVGRARRPSVRTVSALVLAAGLGMLTVSSHRGQLYLGSDFRFDWASVRERLLPGELDPDETTPMMWRVIIASDYFDKHYWGRRYAVQSLVRPIPRALWPTKYEDTAAFVGTAEGPFGFSESEWYSALGNVPAAGTAAGFPADSYLEFGWYGVLVCAAIGWLYGFVWRQSVVRKGVWSIVFLEAGVTSIYLPTQGIVSAWWYRFLFLAIPTALVWAWAVPAVRHLAAALHAPGIPGLPPPPGLPPFVPPRPAPPPPP